ncbi:MAG: cytochrome c oxidase assembly protein [Rhodospirillales bacterium]|nr:cytochrome c oxidase assembly protein [Rhodospirillales bacterium]
MANVRQKNAKTAVVLFSVVAGMIGLAFASVPLYRIFCQTTGLAGTPSIRSQAPEKATDIDFKVRFDANVNTELAWKFKPLQKEITLKLGEERLAFYEATNLSDKTITGSAVFNVTPLKIGQYFVKIDCFCFTEQALRPGETVQMPVSFYVDPAIYEDKNTRDVKTITLSYTFYPVKDEQKVSAVRPSATPGNKG